MKQADDKFTRDLLAPPKRGRPPKPDAKSSAQRVREFRARRKAQRFDFLCNENSPTV